MSSKLARAHKLATACVALMLLVTIPAVPAGADTSDDAALAGLVAATDPAAYFDGLPAAERAALENRLTPILESLTTASGATALAALTPLELDAVMVAASPTRSVTQEVFGPTEAPPSGADSVSVAATEPEERVAVPGANVVYYGPYSTNNTRYCGTSKFWVTSQNIFRWNLYTFETWMAFCWAGPIVDYGDTTYINGRVHMAFYFYRSGFTYEDRNGNKYTGTDIGTFELCLSFLGCQIQKQTTIMQTGKPFGARTVIWKAT